MPILPQFLLAILTLYWSVLTEFFSNWVFANLTERCHTHLLVKVSNHVDFQPIETVCAAYRHTHGAGTRATYSVAVLVRCLLVGYLYRLSLRELEQRICSDMLVRWFVGLSAFDETPDHSTLERFERWVSQRHPRLYHDMLLKQIDEQFPSSQKHNQVGDTYAMLANAAEEDLVQRLRHVIHRLLSVAVNEMPGPLAPTLSGVNWGHLFGEPREKPVFCMRAEEKQRRMETVILAADDLHHRFAAWLQQHSSQEYPDVRQWVGYLGKIIHDEVSILPEPAADGLCVHLRTTQERRSDPETNQRLGSATDPEASYRMHGDSDADVSFGYNIQVAASTDGFIRETQAYTGSVSDQSGIAPLIAAQLEHHNTCPPKLIYDMAAGSGKIRADVELASNGKTLLVARQLPCDKRTARFGPYDFSLSEDGKSLTCPNGKTSTIAYRSGSGDGRDFRFYACQCWSNAVPPARFKDADLALRCPLWHQCRDCRSGPGSMRQVFISDYRAHVLAAKAYNQTETFQTEMKLRPQIERIIFELTNYNGARCCRRRGLENADWQAKMAAVSYNLKLWMRKVGNGEGAAPRQSATPAMA